MNRIVMTAAVLGMTVAGALAQETSSSTQTKTFEVITVEGNRLVVRLPEGTRELTVPDDFRFTVNGQPMSVRELKPGMKGSATITTRTTVTPVTVTEVKNGTVVHASGSSIIVQTEEGYRSFTQADVDKRGVNIVRSGKPAAISDFRQGDRLSATIITSKPPRVLTEQQVQATLAAPAAAPPAAAAPGASAPPANKPAAAAKPAPAPTQTAAADPAPRKLPKTATTRPLVGMLSLLAIAAGLILTVRRRIA